MILKDICQVDWGNTDLTKASYVENGEYLAVSAAGCDGRINHYECEADVPVLSAIGAQCGKMFFPNERFTAIKNTITLTPKDGVLGKYLYYLFTAIELPKRGAGQPFISKGDIEKFSIPKIPLLAIQQKIVTKLDSIFAEIDKATAAAESNANNAEALFHSYLTQVFERGGEGWNTTVLDKVCKVDRGSSPRPIKEYFTEDDDGVNWIKIGDTEEGGKYIFSTNQKITKAGAEKSRYVEIGDFILTNSMSYGRPYIMRINGYIHDGWFVLRLNKDIDSEYFFYLLTSPYVQNQFQSLAAGSVVKNISGDLVKRTILPIPSLVEQKKLAELFSEKQIVLKRLSEVYSEKVNELSTLKQSILTQAFNGELVKD